MHRCSWLSSCQARALPIFILSQKSLALLMLFCLSVLHGWSCETTVVKVLMHTAHPKTCDTVNMQARQGRRRLPEQPEGAGRAGQGGGVGPRGRQAAAAGCGQEEQDAHPGGVILVCCG